MKYRNSLVAAASAALIALGSVASALGAGADAPDFTLRNANGDYVSLSDYQGAIVVLEWTSQECPAVARHYDQGTMTSLSDMHKDDNVVWLAIDSSNSASEETVGEWASERGIEPGNVLLDPTGEAALAYGALTTPHMFVIDAQGKIAYDGAIDNDAAGEMSNEERINYVERALASLLANEPVEIASTPPYGSPVENGPAPEEPIEEEETPITEESPQEREW